MKTNLIRTGLFLLAIGSMLTVYQNCSPVKISPTDTGTASSKTGGGDLVAVATNQDGNMVPVDTTPATDVVTNPPAPEFPNPVPASFPPIGSGDMPGVASSGMPGNHGNHGNHGNPGSPEDDGEGSPGDLASACGLDLKTIHTIIDVAQFGNQDIDLALIKGKTLIYSSDAQFQLKSLNIDVAVGRTILCGVKVDKLSLKKGRLEVYQSEIKEIGEQHGVVIKDASSTLPAGF